MYFAPMGSQTVNMTRSKAMAMTKWADSVQSKSPTRSTAIWGADVNDTLGFQLVGGQWQYIDDGLIGCAGGGKQHCHRTVGSTKSTEDVKMPDDA